MSQNLIDAKGLSRSFGTRKALNHVDLHLAPGEIGILVGANGSGKTTLLKVLAGLLPPDHGDLNVCNLKPFQQRAMLMREARFAFAPATHYPQLTAREHMRYICRLGFAGTDQPTEAQINETLQWVGLAARADEPVRVFSFGMRQRLLLAMALLPRPRLLVLDEPTEGLDPSAIRAWRDLLRSLRDEWGLGILMASHWLHDMENLADQILVLRDGCTVYYGDTQTLMQSNHRAMIQCEGASSQVLPCLQAVGLSVSRSQDGWLVTGNPLSLDHVATALASANIRLTEFRKPTLAESLQHLHAEEA